jgi:hypothetical protein
MAKWQCRKGLHDLGNGCYAYLQPDGVNADRLRRSILQCEVQRGVAEAQAGPLSKRSIADKVGRDDRLSGQRTQAPFRPLLPRHERNEACDRLSGFGDDDLFTGGRVIDEP